MIGRYESMEKITIYHYDAFSRIPNKGNPAGVVINASCLSEKQMQEIAFKVGFNETAFVIKSDLELINIRYFTPGHEMNLCGHATIATLYGLSSMNLINNDIGCYTIETKAGKFPIKLIEYNKQQRIVMGQASPEFIEFDGAIEDIAYLLGISSSYIDNSIPIVYGSTGTWTLLVPIKKLSIFEYMKPKTKIIPSKLKQLPNASIHPFCLETRKSYAHMHARHFSSPYSGTIEDPVTGTASGVMGAYYLTYIDNNIDFKDLIIEQGLEVGRDGEIYVHVERNGDVIDVSISGTAVYVKDIDVEYY